MTTEVIVHRLGEVDYNDAEAIRDLLLALAERVLALEHTLVRTRAALRQEQTL